MTAPTSVHERDRLLGLASTITLGAIIGAVLVFPRRIDVELVNAARRPVALELQGEAPLTLEPGARQTLNLERWRFRRLAWALLPDGGASRHVAHLSPRDFLLYERLQVRLTQDGLSLAAPR